MRTVPFAPPLVAGLLLALVVTSGCARRRDLTQSRTGKGTTEIEIVPGPEPTPRASARRPEPQGAPETLHRRLPKYPEAAIADRVACTARILYHIETDGTATLVRLEWEPAPPAEHLDAFESAIRDAVADWKFKPAFRVRFRMGEDGSSSVERQEIPKSAHALIHFHVRDGRAIVE